jgi:hypothetical protein
MVTPAGVSKWAGTFTRLRSCIVPAEITEPPPKISGGQNHKYDRLVEYFSYKINHQLLNSRIQIEQLRSATTKVTGYSPF